MQANWRGQLLGAALVMFLCLGAAAQDASAGAPSFGWFGGYQNTIVPTDYLSSGGNRASGGWASSMFWDPASPLGLEAEASAYYNNNYCGCTSVGLPPPPVSAATYAFLAGPRLRMRHSRSGVQPYLHFLFGAADYSPQAGSTTAFSMELGGGVDFPVGGNGRLAIRLSPDYLFMSGNGSDYYPPIGAPRNTFRMVVGLVVRFGAR